jgi:hypothetical protein
MKQLKSKTTKIELTEDNKSFVNIILIDDSGEKYNLRLGVRNLYDDEVNSFIKQINNKAEEVMHKRIYFKMS